MSAYVFPELRQPPKAKAKQVYLIASGDLRLSANQKCWPAQHEMELALAQAVEAAGYKLVRAHQYKDDQQHGFIASQKEGMDVFGEIDPKSPLIVAEAVWQYSHHVLAGLLTHRGPVLTVRDHGPGLSEAELGAVFARFARGTAATGVAGSGLGLPIARAIADRHRASISLSPAAGGGAIAEVRFPAAGAARGRRSSRSTPPRSTRCAQ